MNLRNIILLTTILFSFLYSTTASAINPSEIELAFQDGEKLTFVASYALGFLYTDVGEVTINIKKADKNPNEFKVVGGGKTYRFYDRIFKLRDTYEARFSSPDFKSLYFHRDIYEGGYTIKNTYFFDWKQHEITGTVERKKGTQIVNLPMQTKQDFDVLTYFYYFRSIDFVKGGVNTIYPISVVLDDEIYTVGCKYVGKEERRIKAMDKKVNCLKLQLEVIAGEIFKGNEVVTIWVSDDKNHLPVELEFPIRIGKMKGRIDSYEHLKHPINFVK